MNKKERIYKIVSPVALLLGTYFIFGVIDIYSSNINEFSFSLANILSYSAAAFLLLFGSLTVILYILPEKISRYGILLIFGLGTALYIQGNWMPINYGLLNGEEIAWDNYKVYSIINLLIWLLCIAAPFVLNCIFKKVILQICQWISLFIIGIEIVTIVCLGITTSGFHNTISEFIITDNYLLDFSKDKNIIVFVVDECDAQMMNAVLEEEPEYADKLTGFTYFNNTSGKFPWTVTALADIITGIPYDNKQSYNNYINQAYLQSSVLDELQKENYDIGIYTAMKKAVSPEAEYIINVEKNGEKITDIWGFARTYYRLVSFRYAPHFMKKLFWLTSNAFNFASVEDKYQNDNLDFYHAYCNQKISLVNEKQYKLLHIFGCHGPRVLKEDLTEDANGTTAIQTMKGCINILEAFMEQLDSYGVYDNSYIIVLGDHGSYNKRQNPTLMIKPFNCRDEFKISKAPISYDDLPGTLLNAIDGSDENEDIFTISENQKRDRYYCYHDWVSSETMDRIFAVTTYQIGDQASNTDEMSVVSVLYDESTQDQIQLLQDKEKFKDAEVSDNMNACITDCKLSEQGDYIHIFGYGNLLDVNADSCGYYVGLENNGNEKIYKVPQRVASAKPVDSLGRALDIYENGSFLLLIPENEMADAEYKVNVYLEYSGKVYKSERPYILLKNSAEQILKLCEPGTVLNNDFNNRGVVSLTNATTVEEELYLNVSSVSALAFRTITWKRNYDDNAVFKVELLEKDTRNVVYEKDIPMKDVGDNEMYKIDTGNLKINPGLWYVIRFTSNVEDEDKTIALSKTTHIDYSKFKCIVNGKESQPICISIQGE